MARESQNSVGAVAFPTPRPVSFWLSTVAIAVVVLALALGGGTLQGLWSDALVELACLPLLAVVIAQLFRSPVPEFLRAPLALIGAMLALALLQLVPLPPALWTSLPGRAAFVAADQAAGMAARWAPVSLDPGATWFSFFSLLPAVAVFLAVSLLGRRPRRIMSLLILGFAFASVLLGLAQLAGGPTSPLRFYEPTNPGASVGFFANRNHYAALLDAAIPLATAWAVGLAFDRRPQRGLGLILLLVAYSAFLLGLGMAQSRAGLALAFVAGLASLPLAMGARPSAAGRTGRTKLLILLLAGNLCGLALAFQFGFVGIANRLEDQSVLKDLRWPIAAVTTHAIAATLPVGVGFGAFEPIYQMFETRAVSIPEYINHAHDDWLELILDGGLPALALMLAFLFWYGRASVRLWRALAREGPAVDGALARAGPIIAGVLLLHSSVDYPLRTTSLMAVFAFACALMTPPAVEAAEAPPVSAPSSAPPHMSLFSHIILRKVTPP